MLGKDYDPTSSEVMANPFPVYRKFREEAPVQYYSGKSTPYYVFFRHADVLNASTNVDEFSAKHGSSWRWAEPTVMIDDGESHLAFRHVVQARFVPRAMERYRRVAQEGLDRMIDDMVAAGPPADLCASISEPLPVIITLALLGVDQKHAHELGEMADKLLGAAWGLLTPEQEASLHEEAMNTFEGWLQAREKIARDAGVDELKPEHVGTLLPDDLVSDALAGRVNGRRLTRQEMLFLIHVLLVGGIDTTKHLISNLVWRLLEDRSRWEAVMADQKNLIPIAIEESLRFDPPGLGLWRTAARDVEVQGENVPKDAKVQMSYASANRDPRVFDDPETFRLDRPMTELRKHLTFGAGAHLCIGQHLARFETTLALQALFARLPTLRLAGPTERIDNFGFWGRQTLPVAW